MMYNDCNLIKNYIKLYNLIKDSVAILYIFIYQYTGRKRITEECRRKCKLMK